MKPKPNDQQGDVVKLKPYTGDRMTCKYPVTTTERPFCGFPSCNDPTHWKGKSKPSGSDKMVKAMVKTIDKRARKLLRGDFHG